MSVSGVESLASFLAPKVCPEYLYPQKLPDSYLWAEEEIMKEREGGLYEGERGKHPPVLNMANIRSDDEQFDWACREWGLFYVLNHGVKEELITQMEEEGKRIFDLSLDVKLQAHRIPGSFCGYGKPSIGDGLGTLLWSECFTYCSAHENAEQGQYQFINRHAFREYDEAMYELSLKLFQLFSLSIGIDMRELDWMKGGGELGFVHLNHYPPCPEPSNAIGMPPHTDSSLFTIIHQRKTGLQAIRNSHWINIPPLDNTFLVQVGDMLQIVSNDRYNSVVHRAVVKKDDCRHSIAYFMTPPPSAMVKPVCLTLRGGEEPIYGDVSWQQVVEAKRKKPIGALHSFRLL